MPRGIPLPEGWKHTYCTLIAEGYTRSDAAKAVGVSLGTIGRRNSDDDEFRELYQAAREHVRDTLRNDIWKLRLSENDSTARWAYDHLIKWNLPEAKETQTLEIGGTVQIAHEARFTLADILQASRHVEGLGAGARGELPAAGEILAESYEDEPAASDLPVRPAP